MSDVYLVNIACARMWSSTVSGARGGGSAYRVHAASERGAHLPTHEIGGLAMYRH